MDKPIVMKGEPITRVLAYLSKKYPRCKSTLQCSKQLSKFTAFKQADYGLAGDCSITSIASVLYNAWRNERGTTHDFQYIYDVVEANGFEWGYDGDMGTKAYAIRTIFNKSAKEIGVNVRAKSHYGKGVLWNFETVKKQINKGKPAILSFKDDGRDYYGAHSITVIGYAEYKVVTEVGETKIEKFFAVKDNWKTETRWVDYDLIDFVSSLHTY